MKKLGTLEGRRGSTFIVWWDPQSGSVYVGDEHAGEAYTEGDAWVTARTYLHRWG